MGHIESIVYQVDVISLEYLKNIRREPIKPLQKNTIESMGQHEK